MFSRVWCCNVSLNKSSVETDITCNLTRHCGLLPVRIELAVSLWHMSFDTSFLLNCYTWLNITSLLPQRTSTLKSTSFSVCFRGINRLPSAFVFLRWFKLAHISIQVCTFYDGCKQGIHQQIFNMKSISRKITHPQSRNLQAKLTGEKLKGWSNSREKTNSKLQSKFRNTTHKPQLLNKLTDVKNTSGDKT